MFKKTIEYVDFDGTSRKEDFYFNFTKAELIQMETEHEGGFAAMVQKVVDAKEASKLIKLFKEIVLSSYGEKSADGRKFVKSEEIRKDFESTEAYSELYMELVSDDKKAAEFINGIMPADLMKNVNNNNTAV